MKKKQISIYSNGFPVRIIKIGPLEDSSHAVAIISGFAQNPEFINFSNIKIDEVKGTESDSDVEEEKVTYGKFAE